MGIEWQLICVERVRRWPGRCPACRFLYLDTTSPRVEFMEDAYMCRLTQRRIPRVWYNHQNGAAIDHVEGSSPFIAEWWRLALNAAAPPLGAIGELASTAHIVLR
jgi:hypothetical protein